MDDSAFKGCHLYWTLNVSSLLVLCLQLQDVASLTQDVKNQARDTLDKARRKKNQFEDSNKKLKDFIQKIRDFLTGSQFVLFASVNVFSSSSDYKLKES